MKNKTEDYVLSIDFMDQRHPDKLTFSLIPVYLVNLGISDFHPKEEIKLRKHAKKMLSKGLFDSTYDKELKEPMQYPTTSYECITIAMHRCIQENDFGKCHFILNVLLMNINTIEDLNNLHFILNEYIKYAYSKREIKDTMTTYCENLCKIDLEVITHDEEFNYGNLPTMKTLGMILEKENRYDEFMALYEFFKKHDNVFGLAAIRPSYERITKKVNCN